MGAKIKNRLKSPVVVGSIIAAVAGVWTAVTGEDISDITTMIVAVVTNVYAIFAAINNPDNRKEL